LACLAIAGIPPFSGFFSKDEILAAAYEHNKILWAIGVITAGITAFYMFRLYAMTFLVSFVVHMTRNITCTKVLRQ
jgi:NADH-quinone oxidoreductase subunit L